MRAHFFSFICLLSSINLLAQGDGSTDFVFPRHQIRLSLMDAIDPFGPAFMLSYEQFLGKDFSIMAEGGPITTFNGKWINADNFEGYKLRGELRFHTELGEPEDLFFIGLQGMFKHSLRSGMTGNFCRSNCAFYQEIDYSFEKYAAAGHVSLGYATSYGKHFVFEFGGFGGFRYRHGSIKDVPDDAEFQSINDETVINFDMEGPDGILSIGLSMRLGFGW